MFTKEFWKATAERVVASFVGAVLAGLGVFATASGLDITSLDWGTLLKLGAGAALVSLLKGILAAATTGGGPSFTNAETLAQTATVTVPADGKTRVVEFEGAAGQLQKVTDPYSGDTKADAAYHGKHE